MFSDFVYGWLYYANDISLKPAKQIILKFEVYIMKKLEKLIILWGVLDVMTILWYLGWNISKNQMPFVYDIKHQFLNAVPQISMAKAVSYSLLFFLSFMSLIVTGYLLIRLKKVGVVIACVQTSARFTFVPPTAMFLLWPISFFIDNPSVTVGYMLAILTIAVELIKISSMIVWWVLLNRARNVQQLAG